MRKLKYEEAHLSIAALIDAAIVLALIKCASQIFLHRLKASKIFHGLNIGKEKGEATIHYGI